jgi:hypothetical protein
MTLDASLSTPPHTKISTERGVRIVRKPPGKRSSTQADEAGLAKLDTTTHVVDIHDNGDVFDTLEVLLLHHHILS